MNAGHPVDYKLLQYPVLGSTNTHMINLLASGEPMDEFCVVMTEEQSAGRGQGSNRWSSRTGKNLTFSILLLPDIPASDHFYLNMCVSLGVMRAVATYTGGAQVKWPNDIYVSDRKICGILIESSIKGGHIIRSVAGIGINVNQDEFEEWVPNPTSVRLETGSETDIIAILDETVRYIAGYCSMMRGGQKAAILDEYHENMYLRGCKAIFEDADGRFEGTIKGCTEGGLLEIERTDGSMSRYAFKEVKYVR